MLIVVGLGNPTAEYEKTFHNMGYDVVNALCDRLGKKCKRLECSSTTVGVKIGEERVIIAKPLTYMNLSGQAVKSLLTKYKATPSDLLVIYDDIDIDRFTVRARASGSAGTHNGMRNIVDSIGTTEFKRIRIGVGREMGDLKDYVLSEMKKDDAPHFALIFEKVAETIENYAKKKDFDLLMRELNGKTI